jgi:orotidine-5'-phosphate decarboxylase
LVAGGLDLAADLIGAGKKVFLDLKLHDIPNTVAKAVESLGPLPIQMLTLHTAGGGEMMRAARAAVVMRSAEGPSSIWASVCRIWVLRSPLRAMPSSVQ